MSRQTNQYETSGKDLKVEVDNEKLLYEQSQRKFREGIPRLCDYPIPIEWCKLNFDIPFENHHDLIIYMLTVGGMSLEEPYECMEAFASLIMNRWRLQSSAYGFTLQQICLHVTGGAFSFPCWSWGTDQREWIENPKVDDLIRVSVPVLDHYFGLGEFFGNRKTIYFLRRGFQDTPQTEGMRWVCGIGSWDFYSDLTVEPE